VVGTVAAVLKSRCPLAVAVVVAAVAYVVVVVVELVVEEWCVP
jgi:hypothetical protein